jgi:hypothetical protein
MEALIGHIAFLDIFAPDLDLMGFYNILRKIAMQSKACHKSSCQAVACSNRSINM